MVSKKVASLLILVAFLCASVLRINYKANIGLESIASYLIYPVLWVSGTTSQAIKSALEKRRSYQELEAHLKNLEGRYDQLEKNYLATCATKNFDEQVKHIIEFQQRYGLENALLTKILVKQLSEKEQVFIIDKGSRHGVHPDMVAVYKLQIVGKVFEVTPCYSKIQLLTDAHCKIAAFTNQTNAQGILHGTNDSKHCSLNYITQLSKVVPDDLVFTSGQGQIFPEGFCLGKIINCSHKKNDLYYHIDVEPLIDITSITYCLLTDQSKINLF